MIPALRSTPPKGWAFGGMRRSRGKPPFVPPEASFFTRVPCERPCVPQPRRFAAAGTTMMRTGEAASCPPCVAYPHGADGRGVPHTYGAHCGRCSVACPSRVNSHITSSPRIVFEGGTLDGNVHIRTERTLQRVGDVRRRGNSHMPAASTRRQCRDPCGHQPFPMPTALTASPRRGATSGAPASVPLARVAFAWRGPQRRPGPAVRVRRFPGTESAGP